MGLPRELMDRLSSAGHEVDYNDSGMNEEGKILYRVDDKMITVEEMMKLLAMTCPLSMFHA